MSKMNAASALRARMATSFVARRGFSTTRAQLGSPYHYAEGPRSNIPFNPLTKYFFWRYWAFMITGFGAPFAIAGTFSVAKRRIIYSNSAPIQFGKPTRPVKELAYAESSRASASLGIGKWREMYPILEAFGIMYKVQNSVVEAAVLCGLFYILSSVPRSRWL
ncbi:cytochrome c oxidase VIIc family protein [Aspergillus fischeri NRRL 181]|uniref:Cytochrome c oxidase subunit 8, mitochondrial n=1 Tax=Neosartorya fischeri (strain ATCC 1020 / DSM 3700 / CBS 544.65 / FGSC A1164 / JCM 1740 / NRRL 181 / WB 181) TaxID=331117 RepID=A1CXR2_NEOFI|nr:cytochrome c subunit, putative [Aspergillus fischeri NRRL 181]EAW25414.1 cytochrome c subunit, putative [Aspergillus fischeri NRRL 181]KAG2024558.1 hypothetical protein GB937_003750 [Aspergillus fischeri]